jgi:hypothetical protein
VHGALAARSQSARRRAQFLPRSLASPCPNLPGGSDRAKFKLSLIRKEAVSSPASRPNRLSRGLDEAPERASPTGQRSVRRS